MMEQQARQEYQARREGCGLDPNFLKTQKQLERRGWV